MGVFIFKAYQEERQNKRRVLEIMYLDFTKKKKINGKALSLVSL
jgi:hypothetical protein